VPIGSVAVNRFGKILESRLTAQSVALVVKKWALEAGFDPASLGAFPARRARHGGSQGRQERALDPEADRPPLGQRRAPLHPRRRAVSPVCSPCT